MDAWKICWSFMTIIGHIILSVYVWQSDIDIVLKALVIWSMWIGLTGTHLLVYKEVR